MRYFFYVVLTVLVGFSVGCDSTKKLDWTKTVEKQGVRVGDEITVDCSVFDIVNYSYELHTDKFLWTPQEWSSELEVWGYNPDRKSDHDPNAPIGVVVLKIYNPIYSEAMKTLRAVYPTKSSELPAKFHVIRVNGRVTGLNRQKTSNLDGTPSIALSAVQLDVYNVEVIEAAAIIPTPEDTLKRAK